MEIDGFTLLMIEAWLRVSHFTRFTVYNMQCNAKGLILQQHLIFLFLIFHILKFRVTCNVDVDFGPNGPDWNCFLTLRLE